jgi:hypothetical protein
VAPRAPVSHPLTPVVSWRAQQGTAYLQVLPYDCRVTRIAARIPLCVVALGASMCQEACACGTVPACYTGLSTRSYLY